MEKKKSAPITTGDASKRIPKRLYKYTNMAFIESCILNGVYASRLDAVNDPFECDGIKYPQLYRICCMTNSPRQMLLWAYYTQHSECCVEFDVSEISSDLLRHVDYVTSFSAHKNMSLDQIYDSLYRKGKEWEHENEYRAVYYERDFDPSCWTIKNGNIFLKAPVKSVTFGLFSDKETSRYKGALEVLNKYGIEAKRCRLQNNKYALEDDCQFDLNLELENANRLLAINSGGMAEVILDFKRLDEANTENIIGYKRTLSVGNQWTSIIDLPSIHEKGIDSDVTISANSSSQEAQIDIRMLDNVGDVVWSQKNAFPVEDQRNYWCGPNVYKIELRITNGEGIVTVCLPSTILFSLSDNWTRYSSPTDRKTHG